MATEREPAIRPEDPSGVLERAGQHRLRLLPHPLSRSDTWIWERWEEITPADMAEIDRQGGRVACEGCGKEPSRIVRLDPSERN